MVADNTTHNQPAAGRGLSRREFLRRVAALAVGVLAVGCSSRGATPSPTPPPTAEATALPAAAPSAAPTLAPTSTTAAAPAATPAEPLSTPVPSVTQAAPPSPTPSPTPRPPTVAIARAESYDRALVRTQVQALLDGLGGLRDVISPGDRVAIKVNLTGGTKYSEAPGVSRIESYMTHPQVVRALGELLLDAGARELYIVEAIFDAQSYSEFGYADVAAGLGATLVDLNDPAPYSDFDSVPTGEGWFIAERWNLHPILQEVDAFVSVGKMKCHYNAGITLSMKNLIGLVPFTHYRLAGDHWWRSALHGKDDAEAKSRLPRAIVDLCRARPIDLALIDGIKTGDGGEVPRGSFRPVQPGVLLAGKNPVWTDAVGAAVMGFDPTVEPPTAPFLRGDNYLNLAHGLGLGTNRLEEITIAGAAIADVRFPFQASTDM